VIAAAAQIQHDNQVRGTVILLVVLGLIVLAVIVSKLRGRSYDGGGDVPMMTVTDDATGRVVAVYPLDLPLDQVDPAHRPVVIQGRALVAEAQGQVPQWAARNGATGVQQGVPTFRPGSQHIATPVIHRNTGQQIGTRTYQDQGFGARHYGGSYTNGGTYYYDPDNKATVVDWKR
jgi:hypothetical protein